MDPSSVPTNDDNETINLYQRTFFFSSFVNRKQKCKKASRNGFSTNKKFPPKKIYEKIMAVKFI